ncbi:MAG: helix-turn-helix transcriptional regulator [Ruminococcus sp.]|nr:helix-turn-helix transcriptional regulator [Ruminococcus sp.]
MDINSQYETGVISLTAEVLIKLSDFYGVSIDYLLDRTNNPDIVK